jgi:branched-chain amino acid transport system substrate-binding protein
MKKFNSERRVVVSALAGVAALSAFGWTVASHAQSNEPIRIGLIYSKQGPGAAIGQYLQRGSELAVEQAGKKVLGRPIELVWLDEPNPQVSQQNMQRLVD